MVYLLETKCIKMTEIQFDELSKLLFYKEFSGESYFLKVKDNKVIFNNYICDIKKEVEGIVNYAKLRREVGPKEDSVSL